MTIVALCSCATFRTSELEPIQPSDWPPGSAATIDTKPRVNVLVDGQPSEELSWLHQEAIRAFQESRLFSEVRSSPSVADVEYVAKLHYRSRGEFSRAANFLTGVTLFIIPSRASGSLELELSLHSTFGDNLGTVTKREGVQTWFQLFLLPLTPFKGWQRVIRDAQFDLVRSALIDMKRQGLLK